MKVIRMVWLCAAALLSSCYETRLDYDVNADGSGRVTVEVESASMLGQLGNKETAGSQSLAKDVLKKAAGIDTWKDIEVRTLDDGKSYFKGTAYFKDITAVRFKEISMLDSISFSKDAKNNLVVSIGGNSPANKTELPKELSQDDLEKAIKEQRAGFQQIKPMLTAILSTMKTDLSIRLPGKLEKSTNFKSDKQGRLSVSFDGQKFLNALDLLMANDEWIKQQARVGASIKDKPPVGEDINEMVFGEKGPLKAQFKGPFKALFDYDKEAGAARASYDAMLQTLGIDLTESGTGASAIVPAENYKGGDFKSVRIAKVTYADISDPDYQMFGDDRSYQVTFLGELPGAIVAVEKIVLTSAVADNGDNLMPGNEWNRETTWTDLSKDKIHVRWSFTLNQPGPDVLGLGEVAGIMYCQVAGSTKTVDTGIKEWKTGAAGSELGAMIEEIIETEYQHDIKVKFDVDDKVIRELRFFDGAGERLVPTSYYSSTYDGKSSWTSSFDRALPRSGAIKVEINDAVEYYQIPFRVGNVNLFGKPLK